MNINIIFYNSCNWDDVCAVFSNSQKPVLSYKLAMQSIGDNLYSCNVDCEAYNYVYFTCKKGICTVLTSFNKHCYAFMPNGCSFNGILCLEIYHTIPNTPNIEKITFDYNSKIKKDIYVWTPKGYTNNTSKRYGVLYMFDGQNLFYKSSTGYGCWNVHQTMELIGNYIVVAINNGDTYRDSQLTPKLGKVKKAYAKGFSNGTGVQFAEFLINKIIPYINSNYNVFTDKEHTAICGSSSGGLESFYVGMVYNQIFGYIGALSPALTLYDKQIWKSFFKGLTLDTPPRLYMYIGDNDSAEKELLKDVLEMRKYLDSKIGYKSEFIFDYLHDNYHNEACWGGAFIRFADMLK